MEASKKDLTIEDVKDIILTFPKLVMNHIPKKFRENKIISKYIYMSSCLTLIKLFSNNAGKKITTAVFNKNYDLVLYKLDPEYSDVVKVVMNKSLLSLADSIKGTIDKFKVGDYEYEILMNSVFGGTNKNEDYYTLD